MKKKLKKFSCKQECGTNCCSYFVRTCLIPINEKLDLKYYKLHGVEVKEVEYMADDFKKVIKSFMKKKSNNIQFRLMLPILTKLLKAVYKKYVFYIPLKCEWLDKDGKCKHYEDRPEICKIGAGSNPYFPIKNCPYLKEK